MPLLDLLFPQSCALCQKPPLNLCDDCAGQLNTACHQVTRESVGLGYSWSEYQGQVRLLLHRFKTTGSVSLARRLALLMLVDSDVCERVCGDAQVLVPAPSSARANRIRGFSPAAVLAQALARRARQLGHALIVQQPLSFVRQTQNQKRLNKSDRLANLAGSMSAAPPRAGSSFGTGVILVDDVITTGATLAEATRAMVQVGWKPLTFWTFAETL